MLMKTDRTVFHDFTEFLIWLTAKIVAKNSRNSRPRETISRRVIKCKTTSHIADNTLIYSPEKGGPRFLY